MSAVEKNEAYKNFEKSGEEEVRLVAAVGGPGAS